MNNGIAALAVLMGLGSLVCFIIVLIKLFQQEGVLKGILGLICGIWTLIWGWQNADRLGIRTIMMIWTILIVVGIVIRFGLLSMWTR